MAGSWFLFLRRIGVAAVWVLAGVSKLLVGESGGAKAGLESLFGSPSSGWLAWVAVAECVFALLLLTKWWRAAAWASVAMAIVFVVYSMIESDSADTSRGCGCFGGVHLHPAVRVLLLLGLGLLSLSCLMSAASGVSARGGRDG